MRCVCATLLVALGVSPALAQGVQEIVIPGRPDVPIFIDGVDASWAVIESDLGLGRPNGVMSPTIIYRVPPILLPSYNLGYGDPGYYPRRGKRPGYGRLEVVPRHRRLPPPPPTYYRSWSADSASASGPAADYQTNPSLNAPAFGSQFGGSAIGPSFNGSSGPSFNGAPNGQLFNPVPPPANWPWSDNSRASATQGSGQAFGMAKGQPRTGPARPVLIRPPGGH